MTGAFAAAARRNDDTRLESIAEYLTPDLRSRLLDLVAADGRAIATDELERRVQRAEDLAGECQRQLQVRDGQCERLRATLDRVKALAESPHGAVLTSEIRDAIGNDR